MDGPRRSLTRNLISEAGIAIAIIALTNTLFLVYVDSRQVHANPYIGILAWIVAPAILSFGIVLFIAGIVLERRRRRRLAPDQIPEYPLIDLNSGRTRLVIFTTIAVFICFVTASVIGTYQAYHYTESNTFCGATCHQPMHPEYAAYQASPHARVDCVACHVGGGASWYVRSKINGVHQLIGVITGKYPHPIPTPVANMRPAQDTCGQCHWPEKFFGDQLKVFTHFAYDEANTPVEARMVIKTGGGNAAGGTGSGIHWHMNLGNEVTYIAKDRQRQQIPWVRIKDRSGHVTEYLAEGTKMSAAQIASSSKRRMDCIDCHSRPAHTYIAPDRSVDRALAAGMLDRSLPSIKSQAVTALAADYKSTSDALNKIAGGLRAYYAKDQSKKQSVEQAVVTVQGIFERTRFPEMKVDWRTHPDNAGHLYSSGCFRCHDDQHVSADGKRISKDCQTCHTILGGGTFQHPIDLGDLRSVNCADCHTGAGM